MSSQTEQNKKIKQIRPVFTFCIPAYNASEFIERSAGSIIADLGEDREIAEILIIENGSTDNTTEIAEGLQKAYPGLIRCLHSEKGPSCARNVGIRHARGRYIVFVDADDLWINGSVSVMRKLIRKLKADLYCFGFETDSFVQDHGLSGKCICDDTPFKVERRRAWILSAPLKRAQVWAKAFNTQVIRDNQIYFDESIRYCEDAEFLIRFSKCVDSVVVCGKPVYHYSYSSGSLMRGYDENRIHSYLYAMNASQKVLEGESKVIMDAFREYVLCHLNLLLVRNVFNRSIDVSERERWNMMRRICGEEIFRKALSGMSIRQCLSLQMMPELMMKLGMPHAAGAVCAAKAGLNDYREKKAEKRRKSFR